jgi:hypothetical protein
MRSGFDGTVVVPNLCSTFAGKPVSAEAREDGSGSSEPQPATKASARITRKRFKVRAP